MPKSNLPTPEDISGQRSLGTPFTDLQAAIRPLSQYQGDTIRDVGGIPETNNLSNLASSLTKLNPALAQAGLEVKKEFNEAEVAQAKADFAKTRKNYKEAVEAQLIRPGGSRAYVDAYNAVELDTRAMDFQLSLREFYDSENLKDRDNNADVLSKLQSFTGKWRGDILQSPNGQPKYSALDMDNSKFDEKLAHATSSLLAQHNQYRVDERTRAGKEIAQTNAGKKIDLLLDNGTDEEIGKAIKESFFDPITGIASNGITKTEANHLIVDVLRTKAIQYGDDTMMDRYAKHITTRDGATVAGTQYFREQQKAASDAIMTAKIRNSNWQWQQRERDAEIAAGVTPEAKAERQAKLWSEHDAAQKRQLQDLLTKDTADHNKAQSASSVSYVLKGLELKDMNSPFVKKSFDWLRDNDPHTWMTMTNYVASYKKEKSAFTDTKQSELAAAQLRYEITRDPMHFNPASVMAAANNGSINPNKVQPILDDWDKAKTHVDNPFLQNEGFKDIVTRVRMAAAKDMNDQYGPGAIAAMKSEGQLRANAYDWIKKNPQGDYNAFIKEMSSQAELITLDKSPHFAKKEVGKLEKAQNPPAQPAEDTRSFREKYTPNILGGKPAPEPVKPAPTGPPPLKPSEAFAQMKPKVQQQIADLLADPNADEVDIEAAIHNSGLWSWMKSNGRSAAEFKQMKDALLGMHKRK